jgi:hypothetical protein
VAATAVDVDEPRAAREATVPGTTSVLISEVASLGGVVTSVR